jgi:hypothetical protein
MRKKTSDLLPREHGFWAMLGAALLCAVIQAEARPLAWAAALAVLVSGTLLAGVSRRLIRRSGVAQLVSALLLGVAGMPVALAGGVGWTSALKTAIAWMAVFLSSALVVRATFARARRNEEVRAIMLDTSAIAVSAAANIGFALASAPGEALATGVSAIFCALLVFRHPTVKQLKSVGLALAGVALVSALLLGFVSPSLG